MLKKVIEVNLSSSS